MLKTVLLLQAISQHAGDSVELFIPNEKNVDSAFEGSDLESGAAVRCAEKLVRDKVLYKKKIGIDKFQYNAYVNVVGPEELDKFRKQIDARSTTSFVQPMLPTRLARRTRLCCRCPWVTERRRSAVTWRRSC